MNILIVEDDRTSALILKQTLTKAGYKVTTAYDGYKALEALQQQSFDAILTDWMMPGMDGIELIRKVCARKAELPLMIVISARSSEEGRDQALIAGAHHYLAKPYQNEEVLKLLKTGLAERHHHKSTDKAATTKASSPANAPKLAAVCIVAGSGGTSALTNIFSHIDTRLPAAYFVVLHAKAFILESLVENLQQVTSMRVMIASQGKKIENGEIYIAAADHHLCIDAGSLTLQLTDTPPENNLRPSADPLFRSAAKAFGNNCIALVLTGMSRDGALGAAYISSEGGLVIAQSPDSAFNPAMPKNIIDLKIAHNIEPLDNICGVLSTMIKRLLVSASANRKP